MNQLKKKDLIMPYFVVHGDGVKQPINSMPGNFRFSIDALLTELKGTIKLGITAVLLFGLPRHKDEFGSEAYADGGIIQEAVRAIKKKFPRLTVITDVCLCEYTSHGHCGILTNSKLLPAGRPAVAGRHGKTQSLKLRINHLKTLELYAKIAVSHAEAGADIVAPSGMMKFQVRAIRKALDKNGFRKVRIMGYSTKYASAFYGPFREAAESAPTFGDRSGYQMNPSASYRKAIMEVAADAAEGADIIMVKPALAYLDVIREVRKKFEKPLAVYNVSGEYSMLKAAVKEGWIDGRKVMLEIMTALKRAGADIIITYHAKEIAKLI